MFIPDPIFFHPGSRVKKIPDPDSHQRILVFFTQRIGNRKYDLGCSFRIRILIFLHTWVIKALDPESGSVTLFFCWPVDLWLYLKCFYIFMKLRSWKHQLKLTLRIYRKNGIDVIILTVQLSPYSAVFFTQQCFRVGSGSGKSHCGSATLEETNL